MKWCQLVLRLNAEIDLMVINFYNGLKKCAMLYDIVKLGIGKFQRNPFELEFSKEIHI